MNALFLAGYRLVQNKSESVVWLSDITTTKGRNRASATLAKKFGLRSLSILDSEHGNEYVLTCKDNLVARLESLPRWR